MIILKILSLEKLYTFRCAEPGPAYKRISTEDYIYYHDDHQNPEEETAHIKTASC